MCFQIDIFSSTHKMENENTVTTGKNFKFLPYNTGNEPLPMPEYGRNIQQMVDYCVTIPDREERTACAYSIVNVMQTLFPKIADKKDPSKFWDHLNIMARFELDIDFPYPVVSEEEVKRAPKTLPHENSNLRFRHYGRNIEKMIANVADMPDSEEKDELIRLLANHLKKLLLLHNPEGVEDARVFNDMYEYSNGKINLSADNFILNTYKEYAPANQGKKSKK